MESALTKGQTVARKERIYPYMRFMIRRDMPKVREIENKSYEFPWTEDEFMRCLRQRNCIGILAEHEGKTVGFMIYELHKRDIHVINFTVDQAWRRCGVGSRMMAKLIGKLSLQRRSKLLLEVRETNLPAQLFFRHCEFRAVSVLHNFFDDTPEDAYLMRYEYGSPKREDAVLLKLDPQYMTR